MESGMSYRSDYTTKFDRRTLRAFGGNLPAKSSWEFDVHFRDMRVIQPSGRHLPFPGSNPHELVQLRTCDALVQKAELACVFHLARSVEQAGHCSAIK